MDTQHAVTNPVAKKRFLLPVLLLLTGAAVCAAFGMGGQGDFELAKQQVLLRNIGHQILLHAGDSTSRVLPVREVGPREYQLRFANNFTFETDSLVKIISRSLEKDQLAGDYIVTVLDCSATDVLYGYSISNKKQNNIVPCSRRIQPTGCYVVNIKFKDTGLSALPGGYVVGGLSVFAFIGLLAVRRPFRLKRPAEAPANKETDVVRIGNTLFNHGKRQLTISGATTELTPKENKLLKIFAASPGELVERNRIQKEIWEDEGVIVGRSLDVFISKLRKKLEADASIQVVNVHGKGYRLQIDDANDSGKA